MTKILLVDDHPTKRKSLIEALINSYEVVETDQPDRSPVMIEKLTPSIILINRLPLNFDPVGLFLNIKKQYPKIPVLLYALSGPDAFKTLKQTISMALSEKTAIPKSNTNQMASSLFLRTV